MNICWQTPCSVMRLHFILVASSIVTTAGYGLMNNHTSPWNYASRMAMCQDLIEAVKIEHLLVDTLFSDEATFHICGLVNRHNSRIWTDEQSHISTDFEHETREVNVCLGLTQHRIYDPFFFAEATIKSTS